MARIGVLGGIGPDATGEFYLKLISRLRESGMISRNEDFPQIIINSIPAPELTGEEISKNDLAAYAEGLRELDRSGLDFIIMVCNTIHLYYQELQKEIRTPIIDIRRAMEDTLRKRGIKRAFMLGTASSIRKKLYGFDCIEYLEATEDEIRQMADIIFKFNAGDRRQEQKKQAISLCRKYIGMHADAMILACTEFSVMLGDSDMPTVNTIDVMVDAAIERLMDRSGRQ